MKPRFALRCVLLLVAVCAIAHAFAFGGANLTPGTLSAPGADWTSPAPGNDPADWREPVLSRDTASLQSRVLGVAPNQYSYLAGLRSLALAVPRISPRAQSASVRANGRRAPPRVTA